ncbi:predicted protein [Naegleria gruberi]|uniref:Predicted protein n=1 Tax=Naegleria gruberi TaxID=5762 RepID=D2VIY2_NAEGR|nr:uncharacterized protein NAEGRDRAFT_68839 [Naegleria gruberi]EFC43104.1 predicted protein [Naegleria gruberi]|eukprot:XP_002675848.1 predicted protein [Naegleria gruberi strain NEG-M]
MSLFDSSFRATSMVVSPHRYGLFNKRNDEDEDSVFGERIEVDYDTDSASSEEESYGSGPRSFISTKSSNGESLILNDGDSSALDLTSSLDLERKSPASPLFKSILNTSPQHYNPKNDPSTTSLGLPAHIIVSKNSSEDDIKTTTKTIEDEDYACFRLLGLYKHQVTPHDLLLKLFDIFGSTDYTDNTIEAKKKLTFRSAAIAVTMSAMLKSKQPQPESGSEHRHHSKHAAAISNIHKKIRESINGKTGDDKGSPQYLEKVRKRIGYVPKKHMKMMMKQEQEKKEVKKDNNIEDETFNKYKILQNQHQKQKNKYSNVKKRIKYLKFKNIMLESTIYMKDKNNSLESVLGYSTKVIYENPFIDFNTCLNHITTLAKIRFPEMEKNSLEMCSTSLLYPYVLNMMKRALKLVNNFSKWITDDPNVSSLFHYYRPPLLRIFNLFIKMDNEEKQTEAVDIFKTNNTMNIDAFLNFCTVFSITPNMIPEQVAKKIFHNILKEKHSSFLSKKSSNQIRTVVIGDFLEILARLASNFSYQFEDLLKQCQYLLDHLEENYYLLFGEYMSKERKRSYLTKNQPENNLNITKSSFDEATILRKKSVSVNSSVDFYQTTTAHVEEKKIPSILRTVNTQRSVKKPPKRDFIKTEQDLVDYIGEDRFRMMDSSRTLHKVFALYCKDKQGNWSCKDFLNFLEDYAIDKRIKKFQQFLNLRYEDEELFDDLGLPVVDERYLTAQFKSKSFDSSLSRVKLYALFHDVYEEKVKSLSSKDTFSLFLDRVFSKSNYLKAVEKVRERNLQKMKDPSSILETSNPNTSVSSLNLSSISLNMSSSLISIERVRPSTSTSISAQESRQFFTTRVFRQFNLLKGCKIVAYVENRKGCVMKSDNGILPTSFDLNMVIKDKFVERELLSHLTVCETFNQLVDRLLMIGYDIQSKCGDHCIQGSIKCLRFCKRKTLDPVGCIFEMKGQFSSLLYQPTLGDLIRTDCGLTLYDLDPSNILFNNLLKLYKESICIDELTHAIRDLGFDIVNVKFC